MRLIARLLVLGLLLAGGVSACGDDDEAGDAATTTAAPAGGGDTVSIADSAFVPEDLAVAAGTTVTWRNDDGLQHSVVSATDLEFASTVMDEGDEFTFAFEEPGEYAYVCGIHDFMTGTVTVEG